MKEEWRPVIGFEKYYEVSNTGKVKRIAKNQGTYPGKILKGYLTRNGYVRVALCVDCVLHFIRVHRLVAAAFIGPRLEGMVVNHKDCNKQNNAVSNLEYVTPPDNIAHAKKNGCYWSGEDVYGARLTEEKVIVIRRLFGLYTEVELAKKYKVSRNCIHSVVVKSTWKHVA